MDELPTFLKARVKVNVRLFHLELHQQHLRPNILHLIKHLAKVISILRNTEHRKLKSTRTFGCASRRIPSTILTYYEEMEQRFCPNLVYSEEI